MTPIPLPLIPIPKNRYGNNIAVGDGAACSLEVRAPNINRILFGVVTLVLVAVSGTASAQSRPVSDQHHPDVVAVKVTPRGVNRFDFDVTLSSPYDTLQRYADAFRVMDADGKVFGERVLLHDHAGEQPFTRDLYGITIPSPIEKVIVQGRDRKFGYGGKTRTVVLPGR